MEWKVSGTFMGQVVDLTISGEAPTRAPRPATPTATARTAEDIDDEIGGMRAALGANLARLADDMADLMASENRSGKVSMSRLLREVYAPLTRALEKGMTPDALAHGMEVALAKGVPNVNYAKRAAESVGQTAPQRPAAQSGTGAYQVIGG